MGNWYGTFLELPRNPNFYEIIEGIDSLRKTIDQINDSVGLDMSTLDTSIKGNELGFFKIGWKAQAKVSDDAHQQAEPRSADEHICKLSPALEKRILGTVLDNWSCFPCQKRMMDSLSGTDDGVRVQLQLACPLCDLRMHMAVMHHTLDEEMFYEPWRINGQAAKTIREYIEIGCKKSCPYFPRMSILHDSPVNNLPWRKYTPYQPMSDDLKEALLNGSWDVPPEPNKE